MLSAYARLGITPELHRTERAGHAAELARAAHRDGDIHVLGGDGTVMEVVGAMVGSGVRVGIIPGGTGNQLARHLGIPLNVERAVAALATGTPRTMDLARLADGRYFAIAAGLGLDADMIALTSTAAKRRWGVGAYVGGAARALFGAKPFVVRAEVDGKIFEREVSLAMIANIGAVMDGRFKLGPGVRPDDGLLDLCLLSPSGAVDGVSIAARLAAGAFRDDHRMLFARGRHIRVQAPQGVRAEADGEMLAASRLDAQVVANAAVFVGVTGN